jgi:hypothetical protein
MEDMVVVDLHKVLKHIHTSHEKRRGWKMVKRHRAKQGADLDNRSKAMKQKAKSKNFSHDTKKRRMGCLVIIFKEPYLIKVASEKASMER